ncbi:Ubiquinone biosynthesis protein coq9, mitochondrial [Coniosporium apollinis]|uniref:Ubiquinone biosynthesis protein n=2 Tax=Coniosporium TaxID=2810619 RepID=A0ABQ9P3A6_9PEZI|nr:Ubiquinone biosynthesis protein coq9, mitochondrial [Cladosporium sp. JES 115]KAJ9667806.1 Ubiquinone biosynthesis protein coq9, mitochondrial [Coniosporium apollinis]
MASPARLTRATPARHLRISTFRSLIPKPRSYHSYETPQPSPYPPTESAILSSALSHVPNHGFTTTSLRLGARDAGYLDASTNLFPRGAFDLVQYHLVTRRLALKDAVQFPEKLGVGAKVRCLALERLRANREVIHRWQEALAIMAQPTYIPASIAELARLADEIWFLAGDTSVDTSWYTKRASLSAVYSAAEVFMTQDQSSDFKDTERFLDSRLEDLRAVGTTVGSVGEWVDFTGHSFVNLLRSKGVRI